MGQGIGRDELVELNGRYVTRKEWELYCEEEEKRQKMFDEWLKRIDNRFWSLLILMIMELAGIATILLKMFVSR